jgi:hypothetical protein
VESGAAYTWILDEDKTIAPDAEMSIAQPPDQVMVLCRERTGPIIDKNEIIAGALPFGEGQRCHVGSKDAPARLSLEGPPFVDMKGDGQSQSLTALRGTSFHHER